MSAFIVTCLSRDYVEPDNHLTIHADTSDRDLWVSASRMSCAQLRKLDNESSTPAGTVLYPHCAPMPSDVLSDHGKP